MTASDVPNPERFVYRIATRSDWTQAQARGSYAGQAHDARDGFLHLSTRAQVAGTLDAHYPERAGLVLLEIEVSQIAAQLRFEPSRRGELFPHLYGALPVTAVHAVRPIPAQGAPTPGPTA